MYSPSVYLLIVHDHSLFMLENALSSLCVHSRPHHGFLCTSACFKLQPGVRRCSGRHTASSGPPSGSSQSTTKLPPLSWPQTSKLETVRRTAKQDQHRINTGSKQDKQGPAQQSRCTTRNLLRRVLPPGLLKQDKAQRWQRTWKNCGNSAFPGTFQKDS